MITTQARKCFNQLKSRDSRVAIWNGGNKKPYPRFSCQDLLIVIDIVLWVQKCENWFMDRFQTQFELHYIHYKKNFPDSSSHHKNRGIRLILLQKCNRHGCRFDRGIRARIIFFLGPCNSNNLYKKHRMWWWPWLRQQHISMARGASIVRQLHVYFFHFKRRNNENHMQSKELKKAHKERPAHREATCKFYLNHNLHANFLPVWLIENYTTRSWIGRLGFNKFFVFQNLS